MNRRIPGYRAPDPKPVEKVELSEKHFTLRLVIVIASLAVALVAIGFGIYSLLTTEAGWREIAATAYEKGNLSSEFVFQYELGRDGRSATKEYKQLTAYYTDLVNEAYHLFHSEECVEGVHNVAWLNAHPNETATVSETLYQAFSLMQERKSRLLYLGPVYADYACLYLCENDTDSADYDPHRNAEAAAYYAAVCAFAGSDDHITLELLSGNQVRLSVSAEYLAFAEQHHIGTFIDFAWLKNAFIADFLADRLTGAGYTAGYLLSYDGYARGLDDTPYTYGIYDKTADGVYPAARVTPAQRVAAVTLCAYPTAPLDDFRFYVSDSGFVRTPYIDPADGFDRAAVNDLFVYSPGGSCAGIALAVAPIYTSDTLDEGALAALQGEGIRFVRCADRTVRYNDPTLSLTDLFSQNGVTYTARLVG